MNKILITLYSKFPPSYAVILITVYTQELDVINYIRVYKKTRKHLFDLQNADIYMISTENMRVLFKDKKLKKYKDKKSKKNKHKDFAESKGGSRTS